MYDLNWSFWIVRRPLFSVWEADPRHPAVVKVSRLSQSVVESINYHSDSQKLNRTASHWKWRREFCVNPWYILVDFQLLIYINTRDSCSVIEDLWNQNTLYVIERTDSHEWQTIYHHFIPITIRLPAPCVSTHHCGSLLLFCPIKIIYFYLSVTHRHNNS